MGRGCCCLSFPADDAPCSFSGRCCPCRIRLRQACCEPESQTCAATARSPLASRRSEKRWTKGCWNSVQTVRESHEVRRYLQSDEFCQRPVVTGFDTFGDGNAHRPSASHVAARPARNCFIDKDGRPVTQGQCQRRIFSTVLTHGLREEKSGARTHNPTVPYLIMYSTQARSCGLESQTPFVSNPS